MDNIPGTWFSLLGVVFATLIGVGWWINRRPLGILIDSRNRMSLSRLQIVAWTWLLTSSFLAVALYKRTLEVVLEPELWALMGISVASAAGAVLIKGTKSAQEPDPGRLSASAAERWSKLTAKSSPEGSERRSTQERQGLLVANTSPRHASLADLFTGEELTDATYVDIAKVQMFVFTVAMLLGYARTLSTWDLSRACDQGDVCFPGLSEGLLALLGISHAGYLTVKAAPKTPTN